MTDYILTQTAEEVQEILNRIENYTFGGSGDTSTLGLIISCETDMSLLPYTCVIFNNDKVIPANASNIDHAHKVVGIAITHSTNGYVKVQIGGVLESTSWSLQLGKPIFLSINGLLTQTPNTIGGFSQILGYAISSTKMFIKIHEPIVLD
jgi:hypothetical protein